ncbi:CHRD domain-containing protein [Fulvivirgaceae bacterium LMO-SS25]
MNFKTITQFFKGMPLALLFFAAILVSCNNEEDDVMPIVEDDPALTGDTKEFPLMPVSNDGISGMVTFLEQDDNSTKIIVQLNGTTGSTAHPAHIHFNTAAEGGDIAVSLEPVDPATGRSETIVTADENGQTLSFQQLLTYDGYVNVHASMDDLATLIAQGDIGQNVLTGNQTTYALASVDFPRVSGVATISERANGESLVSLRLMGTVEGEMYPAHIHLNTAAEGGAIAVSLGAVPGGMGEHKVSVSELDNGTAISYSQLLEFDGYINVHLSMEQLDKLVSQGDIGENALTGASKIYKLNTVDVNGISGIARFDQRKNGEALVTLKITGTPQNGMHPAHIHFNTAAEGGGIAISLTNVNGATGMSKTSVSELNSGEAISYSELLDYNGYINVHLSTDQLGVIVAQGDIGMNELTGNEKTYNLAQVGESMVSGTAKFAERKNGDALVTLMLNGTMDGGMHPSHIHFNTAAEGGDIAIPLADVNGATGLSKTSVKMLTDGTAISYAELLNFNGYINVHNSIDDLGTLLSQVDIGQNELTGSSTSYNLAAVGNSMVSGTAKFEERKNGNALVTLMVDGTMDGGMHPSHIHFNTAAEGGDIAVMLADVDGATGLSKTSVKMLTDGTAISYEDLLDFDGYINVHNSIDDLGTLLSQVDIGRNALTGNRVEFNLGTVGSSGVSGTVTFLERKSGETLANITLTGTMAGGMHPAHVHNGSLATQPGSIAIDLGMVNGATGMVKINVTEANGTPITYSALQSFDGYVNVHKSMDELNVILAQGDVLGN